MKFWMKQHDRPLGKVLAACDEELLGKTLENDKAFIVVKEDFYRGELVDSKALLAKLKKAENINVIGKECVKLAVDAKVADKGKVGHAGKVPYALVFVL